MFVSSGTVGNYFFAFRYLVDVCVQVVCWNVDRTGDMTLRVLVGRVCVDEDRGACVEIFLRVGERDPRSGVLGVAMTIDVNGSGWRSACNSHGRSRSVITSRGKNDRGDQ